MTLQNEHFQQERLDEQLDALARAEAQTPTSRAYQGLRRFHASRAAEEARALERVRLRLAARAPARSLAAGSALPGTPGSAPLPLPARPRRPRHVSRLRAMLSTAAAIVVVGLLVGGFAVLLHPRQVASTPFGSQPGWQIVSSPNTAFPINALKGVAVLNSADAWAVGLARQTQTETAPILEVPLVEHWNGSAWQIVATPTLAQGGGFFDVVGLAPNNVWAVGEAFAAPGADGSSSPTTALIEHWDGRQWTVVQHPAPAGGSSVLKKLAALSADDIWAVGSFSAAPTSKPQGLIEHWNGTRWQIVPAPSQPAGEQLTSISALAPDNIWAAGYSAAHTLIEHWDGAQWQIVPSPNTGATDALTGISAVSANDIWAIGVTSRAAASNPGPACCYAPLLEHWDGQQWRIVASPTSAMIVLYNMLALGPDDIWAVGETWQAARGDPGYAQGLIEHWNGKAWSQVSNPHPQRYVALSGIASDPSAPGKLWIVGSAGPQNKAYDGLSASTFIETSA